MKLTDIPSQGLETKDKEVADWFALDWAINSLFPRFDLDST